MFARHISNLLPKYTRENLCPTSYPFVPEGKRGILACNLANGELRHWREWRGLYRPSLDRRSSFETNFQRRGESRRLATKIFSPFCLTYFYLLEIFSANEFERKNSSKISYYFIYLLDPYIHSVNHSISNFSNALPVNSFVKK